MLKIGDISKITNLSVKTIRFYEAKGLLQPVEVDQWTGYRYYDETSVKKLSEIVYLKNLGFTLKEISSFHDESIQEKTKELQIKIRQLQQMVSHLSTIKKEGEQWIMKPFVNDPQVIGKWQRIAIVKEKEDFAKKQFEDENIFNFKELYFLPNGEQYWVLRWSKNVLYVNGRPMPYEIVDGNMYIGIVDLYSKQIENYAVYKQLDHKSYKKQDIKIKENIQIPFVNDPRVLGYWETVDHVKNFQDFQPDKTFFEDELFLKALTFNPKGTVFVEFQNVEKDVKWKWSKGLVLNPYNETASAYEIKTINHQTYLCMEWKSGDFVFGGEVKGKYVLKKIQ